MRNPSTLTGDFIGSIGLWVVDADKNALHCYMNDGEHERKISGRKWSISGLNSISLEPLSAKSTVLNHLWYLNNFTCRYFRQVRISKSLLFELACRRRRRRPGFLDGAVDTGICDIDVIELRLRFFGNYVVWPGYDLLGLRDAYGWSLNVVMRWARLVWIWREGGYQGSCTSDKIMDAVFRRMHRSWVTRGMMDVPTFKHGSYSVPRRMTQNALPHHKSRIHLHIVVIVSSALASAITFPLANREVPF